MEAIKSYFSRILPSGHAPKAGSGRRAKGSRIGGGGKKDANGQKPPGGGRTARSASTPHIDNHYIVNNNNSNDTDNGDISQHHHHHQHRHRRFSLDHPLLSSNVASPERRPDSRFGFNSSHSPMNTNSGYHANRNGPGPSGPWEGSRTPPPPTKPPRRDRLFRVDLITAGSPEIGIEVDVVPLTGKDGWSCGTLGTKTGNSVIGLPPSPGLSSPPSPSLAACRNYGDACSSSPSSAFSALPPPPPAGCVVRVVGVLEGGLADQDGRVRVQDEVLDINGKTLLREGKDSVRQLVRKAALSGRVTMTLRRRRGRTGPLPSLPIRSTPSLQESPCTHRRAIAQCRPYSINNTLSFSASCLPHDSFTDAELGVDGRLGRGEASQNVWRNNYNDNKYGKTNRHRVDHSVGDQSPYTDHHYYQPVSLSSCDLDDSSDEVFVESTVSSEKVVPARLTAYERRKMFRNGSGSAMNVATKQGVRITNRSRDESVHEDNGNYPHRRFRSHSSSAVEDWMGWGDCDDQENDSGVVINNTNNIIRNNSSYDNCVDDADTNHSNRNDIANEGGGISVVENGSNDRSPSSDANLPMGQNSNAALGREQGDLPNSHTTVAARKNNTASTPSTKNSSSTTYKTTNNTSTSTTNTNNNNFSAGRYYIRRASVDSPGDRQTSPARLNGFATNNNNSNNNNSTNNNSNNSNNDSGSGSNSRSPIRRLMERSLLKRNQQMGQQRSQTASPGTVSLGGQYGVDGVHSYRAACSSSSSSHSPASCPKKRVISKIHLVKDHQGLGLHIAGGKGSKKGDIGIFVAALTEGASAFRDGRLKRGDELLMINGHSLVGLTHQEAVEVLRKAPTLVQLVVATKLRKSASIAGTSLTGSTRMKSPVAVHSLEYQSSFSSEAEPKVDTSPGSVISYEELAQLYKLDQDKIRKNTTDAATTTTTTSTATNSSEKDNSNIAGLSFGPVQTMSVHKGASGKGLGFTIIGGADSNHGTIGIYVRRVFLGGIIAEDGRLKEGDEITSLNGQSLQGITHKQVLTMFRSLPSGPVTLTFRPRIDASICPSPTHSASPMDESSVSDPSQSPRHTPQHSMSGSPVSLESSPDTNSGHHSASPPPPLPIQRMSPIYRSAPCRALSTPEATPDHPAERPANNREKCYQRLKPKRAAQKRNSYVNGYPRQSSVGYVDEDISACVDSIEQSVELIPRNFDKKNFLVQDVSNQTLSFANKEADLSDCSGLRQDLRSISVDRTDQQVHERRQQIAVKSPNNSKTCQQQCSSLPQNNSPSACQYSSRTPECARRVYNANRLREDSNYDSKTGVVPPPMFSMSPSCLYTRRLSTEGSVSYGSSSGCLPSSTSARSYKVPSSPGMAKRQPSSPVVSHRPLPLPPQSSVKAKNAPCASQYRHNGGLVHMNEETKSHLDLNGPMTGVSSSVNYHMESVSSAIGARNPFPSPFPSSQCKTPPFPVKAVDDPCLRMFHNQTFAALATQPNPLLMANRHPELFNQSHSTHLQRRVSTATSTSTSTVPQHSFLHEDSNSSSVFHYHRQSSEITVSGNSVADGTDSHYMSSPRLRHHVGHCGHHTPVASPLMQHRRGSLQENGRGMCGGCQPPDWEIVNHRTVCNNMDILLHKVGEDSVGISVIRTTAGGNSTVQVQDITPGSLADRDGRLQKGDVLYSVNGKSMANLSLLDAFQLFCSLPPGPIRIRAARMETTYIQLMRSQEN